MNDFNQTLAGLSRGDNPALVTNGGAGPAVLTIDNAVNSLYTGGIEDGSGGLSLVKTGSGSFTDGFANPFGGGSFAVAQVGNDLELVYTPGSTPTDIVIDVAAGTETPAAWPTPTSPSTPLTPWRWPPARRSVRRA